MSIAEYMTLKFGPQEDVKKFLQEYFPQFDSFSFGLGRFHVAVESGIYQFFMPKKYNLSILSYKHHPFCFFLMLLSY